MPALPFSASLEPSYTPYATRRPGRMPVVAATWCTRAPTVARGDWLWSLEPSSETRQVRGRPTGARLGAGASPGGLGRVFCTGVPCGHSKWCSCSKRGTFLRRAFSRINAHPPTSETHPSVHFVHSLHSCAQHMDTHRCAQMRMECTSRVWPASRPFAAFPFGLDRRRKAIVRCVGMSI